MGKRLRIQGFVVALALAAGTLPVNAEAGTAQAQFGLRLVIAPPCTASDNQQQTDGAAGTRALALDLAAAELGLPANKLLIAHDQLDTGWWIVSLSGRGGPEAVLRVEKCTGAVERI